MFIDLQNILWLCRYKIITKFAYVSFLKIYKCLDPPKRPWIRCCLRSGSRSPNYFSESWKNSGAAYSMQFRKQDGDTYFSGGFEHEINIVLYLTLKS